jgi:His-Xaa-Ser system radical SAM maturase HxsB
MLAGPSSYLKVEFQGGESLLNFPLVKRIVERVEREKGNREVSYVVATNLTVLTDEMLDYFAEHKVFVSTSIDGPANLHNTNRPKEGKDSHSRVCDGIRRCRERLGHDSVSALMTCSSASLDQPEAIIDEYVRLGFTEVFLRHISPYGFAARSAAKLSYNAERYLEFYRRGLAYILDLNKRGTPMRESYTSLVLRRMFTSYPTGYVDLQSPTGAALGALVYNYDGGVYASDEGRMLAEMGDQTFRLGNVHQSSWESLFLDSPILDIAYSTMVEGMPNCSECAFQTWCGSDPVRHHTTQGDFVGHKPSSEFCYRNMETMRHLVRSMEDDHEAARILRDWIR